MVGSIAFEAKFRSILRRYGFELYRTATLKRGAQYDLNIPHANYAPWNVDADFLAVYERIRNDCFVDKYRCHELWKTVIQTAGVSGSIIEVGVWRGGTASIIASAARKSGSREPIYLCENFRGVVKPSEKDTHYRGGEHADSSLDKIHHFLGPVFGIDGYQVLDGIFPEETGKGLEGERFKFAHIDVDTYQSAKDAFEFIFPRTVSGGCIVFDDYGFSRCDGVTKLVDGFFGRKDLFLIHNLNGHAVLLKR